MNSPPGCQRARLVQSLNHDVNILSLTTLRELARLSLPMVVSQGAFAVMVFTDRWFMSLIDPTHIAAALGGGVASFFCFSLFIGVITYANALVAVVKLVVGQSAPGFYAMENPVGRIRK